MTKTAEFIDDRLIWPPAPDAPKSFPCWRELAGAGELASLNGDIPASIQTEDVPRLIDGEALSREDLKLCFR